MKHFLLLALLLTLVLPGLVLGEGSRQLTPRTTTDGVTSNNNTTVGYLQHDDNGTQTISYGFLKPHTWSYNGATFIEDYRMHVRMRPGETLYYGVRRMRTNEAANTTNTQRDLILTLKYGPGAGNVVKTNTLLRNQSTQNHSSLITPQAGVIASPLQSANGPNYGGRTNGYIPLSYTNNTGSIQDFYLEFTQFDEATMDPRAKKSWYDLWDLTVVGTDGLEKPGRLYSKQWSFTAGGSSHVLSRTFAFFPLIPNQLDGSTYYVKKITLAGMRPFGFRFVTNQYGSTEAFGSTFQERRKSQTVQSDYSEYMNFINDPDIQMWPSAVDPDFSFSANIVCDGGEANIVFTSNAGVSSNFVVQIDVNGDGYKANTADIMIERTFEAGTNKLIWDGRDAYGNKVPSGVNLNYTYRSYTSPMNFPVFDAEGNASGFKSENVRPVPSTVNDFLFWDDSKLPQDKFSSQLNGFNASAGAHLWGATADDGDYYTVNTWTYGYTYTKEESLSFNYNCATDLSITNTTPYGPYYEGDLITFNVTVTNNGPTDSKDISVDYPIFPGFEFVEARPVVGTYDVVTGKWLLGITLPVGESRTMIFEARAVALGILSTTAVVSTTQTDTNPNNNSATARIQVLDPATQVPMPVKLIYFTGKGQTDGIKLNWAISGALPDDYYVVQRSLNGRTFTDVASQQTKSGESDQKGYSFLDTGKPAGVIYYRLKIVETTGKVLYSNLISVSTSIKQDRQVHESFYPNPVANGVAALDITHLPEGNYNLILMSSEGKLLRKITMQNKEIYWLNTSNLAKGHYILRVDGDQRNEVYKFVKL